MSQRLPLKFWRHTLDKQLTVDVGYRIIFYHPYPKDISIGADRFEGVVYQHQGVLVYCCDDNSKYYVLSLDQITDSEKCSKEELLTHHWQRIRNLAELV